MEINIKIESIESKMSKGSESRPSASYVSVSTNQGKMTCFEESITTELMRNIGKIVRVDMQESKGYKNIRSFIGTGEALGITTTSDEVKPSNAPVEKIGFTASETKTHDEGKRKTAICMISEACGLANSGKIEKGNIGTQALALMKYHKELMEQ